MASPQLFAAMASTTNGCVSITDSDHSNADDSLHPNDVSHLFNGDLSDDELNEIPALFEMHDDSGETYEFDAEVTNALLDENHPATQIALTASALDGALCVFEFLPVDATPSFPQDPPVPILPAEKGKRSRVSKSPGATSKRRRVSKPKTKGAPIGSPVLEPPVLISPSSSVALISNRQVTITPPPHTSMPVLPDMSAATTQLLPRPSKADPPQVEPTTSESPTEFLRVPEGPLDISTDHILKLIGEEGPVECSKAISASSIASDGRRVSKSHLSKEERAQASRNRNREHARNTRLRKKAYVDSLKRTLEAMCAQRDTTVADKERQIKLEQQNKEVRFSVLQEFLRLRGGSNSNANANDPSRWSTILLPSFSLSLPTIDAQGHIESKTLSGVTPVMKDSLAFLSFLWTVGAGKSSLQPQVIGLQYSVDQKNLFMDGNTVVLEWEASTAGAVANGAHQEVQFYGNIRAQFDPESNKMVSAKMLFDAGSVVAQMRNLAFH